MLSALDSTTQGPTRVIHISIHKLATPSTSSHLDRPPITHDPHNAADADNLDQLLMPAQQDTHRLATAALGHIPRLDLTEATAAGRARRLRRQRLAAGGDALRAHAPVEVLHQRVAAADVGGEHALEHLGDVARADPLQHLEHRRQVHLFGGVVARERRRVEHRRQRRRRVPRAQ